MKLSKALRKRFCKDFSLPIGLFDDYEFSYFIEYYDTQYDTQAKLKLLIDAVTQLGGEEAFMQEFNRIKDAIISDVSNTDAYKELATLKDPRPYDKKYDHSGQNIYHSGFNGREIISIDLCKANFQSLKTYDVSILNDADTWSEFLSKYTDLPYYHQSKQLRQVIFGNLMPKRQQAIQKSMCNEIADVIKDIDNELDVAIVSTDEILILNFPDAAYGGPLCIAGVLNEKLGYTDNELHIESFRLEKIHPDKSYFVKRNLQNGKLSFKSIPQIFFAQVYAHYFGKLDTEINRTFFHEGQTAVFKESIYKDMN